MNDNKTLSPGGSLRVLRTLGDIRAEREVSAEYLLPDYFGDVRKILLVTAAVRPGEIYPSADKVEFGGEVAFTVWFVSEDGALHSIVLPSAYDASADCGVRSDIDCVRVSQICTGVSGRLLGPRKLSVKCRLEGHVVVETVTSLDVETDAADEISTVSRTASVTAMNRFRICENDISISEDIEPDASLPPIQDIIWCGVRVFPRDCRIENGSYLLLCDAVAECVYTSQAEGETVYSAFTKQLPIEERIDGELPPAGADYALRCAVTAGAVKAQVTENNYGERRLIELDFPISAVIDVFYNISGCVCRDMYSTAHPSVPVYKEADFPVFRKLASANFSLDASHQRDNGGNSKVLFASAEPSEQKKTFDASKSRLIIEGESAISVIMMSPEEEISSESFNSPFRCEIDATGISGAAECEISLAVSDLRIRCDSDDIRADYELRVTALLCDRAEERVVGTLSVERERNFGDETRAALLLYYPHSGETAWDAAKKYHTTAAEIFSENGMEGADAFMPLSRPVFIPKRRRPSFEAAI